MTQIIELEDGLRIEAEVTEGQVALQDGTVNKTMDSIRPMVLRVVEPVATAWNDISQKIVIEKAEIELGFGIEASGNFFLASTKGNVNVKITLVVSRPKTAA